MKTDEIVKVGDRFEAAVEKSLLGLAGYWGGYPEDLKEFGKLGAHNLPRASSSFSWKKIFPLEKLN